MSALPISPLAALAACEFALAAAAGAVMQRSSFCMAGAFRDLFLFRTARPLASVGLLVCLSAVLIQGARGLGLLPLYPFPLLGSPSWMTVGGGLLFGVGMVLAGGCVVGTLYQAGTGRPSAWWALAGLLLGSAAYAEWQPWLRALDQQTVLFAGARTLPQVLGVDPALLALPPALLGAAALWRRRPQLPPGSCPVAGAVAPWKAAAALAAVTAASMAATGVPLGVTTTYAKAVAALEALVAPAHAGAVAYFRMGPFGYVHPWSGLRLAGGPGPHWDGVSLLQVPVIAGIFLGAAASALSLGELRPRWRLPRAQAASALVGGVLMALGSRVGAGCNLWHVFGGLPVLATTSLLFTAGLFPGAWLGGKILVKSVMRP